MHEMQHRDAETGGNLYLTLRRPDGSQQYWNVVDEEFQALTVENWLEYAIAMTESPIGSYLFLATLPPLDAEMQPDWYWVDVFYRVPDVDPAISDERVAGYLGYWNGTRFRYWAPDDAATLNQLATLLAPLLWQNPTRTVTDVLGKVLGGGSGVIAGIGANVNASPLVATAYLVADAPEGVSSVWVDEGTLNGVTDGDLLHFVHNGEVVQVAQLVSATGMGNITVAFQPPLRQLLYEGDAIRAFGIKSMYTGAAVDGVRGNVGGKVLGGGSGVISGVGAKVDLQTIKNRQVECNANVVIRPAVGTTNLLGVDAIGNVILVDGSLSAAKFAADAISAAAISEAAVTKIQDGLAAQVWLNPTRTLTTPAVQLAASVLDGATIAMLRGDSFSADITGLGSLAEAVDIWFTVKPNISARPDQSATVQISSVNGLLRLVGKVANATLGTLTVLDAVAGNLRIAIQPAATAALPLMIDGHWDIQMLTAAGAVRTLTTGTFIVVPDVTRRIS